MNHDCTVYKTMDYLAKKWSIMILWELYKETDGGKEWKRFSKIKSGMKDVTAKVLSERLKELAAHGLVENRIDDSEFPAKSEYRLTESAIELMQSIYAIKMWALKWNIDNPVCHDTDCKTCGL